MTADETISRVLTAAGVELFAPIPLSDCRVTKKYLLERAGIEKGTVYACAVPYLSRRTVGEHNISAYAAVRDYHAYFAELWRGVTQELCRLLPENRFAGFADHSPIDERDAALKAGLGVLGQNGMLITEKYSSYVFLGELITDAEVDCKASEIKFCEGCGLCKSACPMHELGECLSWVTQKKGELSETERAALVRYNTAWGCDICQRVCPHTRRAVEKGTVYTNIEYFLKDVIPDLDSGVLNAMSDAEFSSRAFSWRGRQTVSRNLEILEKALSKKTN